MSETTKITEYPCPGSFSLYTRFARLRTAGGAFRDIRIREFTDAQIELRVMIAFAAGFALGISGSVAFLVHTIRSL